MDEAHRGNAARGTSGGELGKTERKRGRGREKEKKVEILFPAARLGFRTVC